MLFSLLKPSQSGIEAETRDWIIDVFSWALNQFDRSFFYDHSELILPNNDFFPGRANSEQGMAELIFNQVSRYAGVGHWPVEVTPMDRCMVQTPVPIAIPGPLRLTPNTPVERAAAEAHLHIPYNPQQLNNPEGLISSFAHVIAHYLGQFANQPPPGDPEYWPQVTEILAIFLGFGLMFANSAYTFRGGCGSCYNPAANRDAALTERQSTYALALFVELKGVEQKLVTRNLKGHLRGFYRRASKELQQLPVLQNLRP